jgi:acyl carrier protein
MGRRVEEEPLKPTLEEEITQMILKALRGLRTSRGKRRMAAISPTTRLYGHGSDIDSLGLVQLLIDVEERVSDRYGVPVSLADEKAMSQAHSPFRSVDSLAQYLTSLIAGHHGE